MIVFKTADSDKEMEQIHRLNYRAFVEEIPQHAPNVEKQLVDKFHSENTYVTGLDGGNEIVAMVALRNRRPFSLDGKLENLDSYLPAARSIGEIRLLYIIPRLRTVHTLRRLLAAAVREALEKGWDSAVISGTTRQAKLYRHLGFVPFGPLVGTAEASFQPMYLSREAFEQSLPWLAAEAKATP